MFSDISEFSAVHGICILYTKHKNQNGYSKLSEYCEQYERLENFELYALLENSDKGSAGLSKMSEYCKSYEGFRTLYTVHCIQTKTPEMPE